MSAALGDRAWEECRRVGWFIVAFCVPLQLAQVLNLLVLWRSLDLVLTQIQVIERFGSAGAKCKADHCTAILRHPTPMKPPK
jgi:hypothetical protein